MSPVFARKILRQALGRDRIGDTIVSTTTGSLGSAQDNMYVIDSMQANLAFSGQKMYERRWGYVNGMDFRVASFNSGSGAYVTQQTSGTSIPSGAEYELHSLLSPDEKDRAIDAVVRRLKRRIEVPVQSTKDLRFYDVEHSATPSRLVKVFDVYYFGDPANSLSRDKKYFDHWELAMTATGTRELRVKPSLDGSAQIVLDALVQATLGAGDAATVWLPDEDWALWGAEVECWNLLSKRTPGQNADHYRTNRREAAREFSRLSARFAPQVDSKLELDNPL